MGWRLDSFKHVLTQLGEILLFASLPIAIKRLKIEKNENIGNHQQWEFPS